MVWKCLSDEAEHLGRERVQALNQSFDVVGQENHGLYFAVLLNGSASGAGIRDAELSLDPR